MRWEADKSTTEHEVYHLYKGDKKELTVVYNQFSNSARIECTREKRVFLIRKEGFRRNKKVIRNEYGIKIGEFGQENGEHFIDINEERYFYTTINNPLAELIIYRDAKENPLVTCGLKVKNGSTDIRVNDEQQVPDGSHPGLLMAICWYMFLPVAKENTVELAVQL